MVSLRWWDWVMMVALSIGESNATLVSGKQRGNLSRQTHSYRNDDGDVRPELLPLEGLDRRSYSKDVNRPLLRSDDPNGARMRPVLHSWVSMTASLSAKTDNDDRGHNVSDESVATTTLDDSVESFSTSRRLRSQLDDRKFLRRRAFDEGDRNWHDPTKDGGTGDQQLTTFGQTIAKNDGNRNSQNLPTTVKMTQPPPQGQNMVEKGNEKDRHEPKPGGYVARNNDGTLGTHGNTETETPAGNDGVGVDQSNSENYESMYSDIDAWVTTPQPPGATISNSLTDGADPSHSANYDSMDHAIDTWSTLLKETRKASNAGTGTTGGPLFYAQTVNNRFDQGPDDAEEILSEAPSPAFTSYTTEEESHWYFEPKDEEEGSGMNEIGTAPLASPPVGSNGGVDQSSSPNNRVPNNSLDAPEASRQPPNGTNSNSGNTSNNGGVNPAGNGGFHPLSSNNNNNNSGINAPKTSPHQYDGTISNSGNSSINANKNTEGNGDIDQSSSHDNPNDNNYGINTPNTSPHQLDGNNSTGGNNSSDANKNTGENGVLDQSSSSKHAKNNNNNNSINTPNISPPQFHGTNGNSGNKNHTMGNPSDNGDFVQSFPIMNNNDKNKNNNNNGVNTPNSSPHQQHDGTNSNSGNKNNTMGNPSNNGGFDQSFSSHNNNYTDLHTPQTSPHQFDGTNSNIGLSNITEGGNPSDNVGFDQSSSYNSENNSNNNDINTTFTIPSYYDGTNSSIGSNIEWDHPEWDHHTGTDFAPPNEETQGNSQNTSTTLPEQHGTGSNATTGSGLSYGSISQGNSQNTSTTLPEQHGTGSNATTGSGFSYGNNGSNGFDQDGDPGGVEEGVSESPSQAVSSYTTKGLSNEGGEFPDIQEIGTATPIGAPTELPTILARSTIQPTPSPVVTPSPTLTETEEPTTGTNAPVTLPPTAQKKDEGEETQTNKHSDDLWDDDTTNVGGLGDNSDVDVDQDTVSVDKYDNLENELEVKERREKLLSASGVILGVLAMIFTAYQMSENPDGIYAAACRFCITVLVCLFRIIMSPCKGLLGYSGLHRHSHYGHVPVSTMDYGYRDPSVELQLQ